MNKSQSNISNRQLKGIQKKEIRKANNQFKHYSRSKTPLGSKHQDSNYNDSENSKSKSKKNKRNKKNKLKTSAKNTPLSEPDSISNNSENSHQSHSEATDSLSPNSINNIDTSKLLNQNNEKPDGSQDTHTLDNNADFIAFDFSEDDQEEEDDDDDGNEENNNSISNNNLDADDSTYIPSINTLPSSGSLKRKRSDDDYGDEDDTSYTPSLSISESTNGSSHSKSRKRMDRSSQFPWLQNKKGKDHSMEPEVGDWLTAEIFDFVKYLSPSKAEILARNNAVQRMRDLVATMWQDATVHVFGSYATDMYLPGSDIDMVITSPSERLANKTYLYQLGSKLRSPAFSRFASSVQIISKTRVPIIKYVDTESNIHIDLSFERRNGLVAVEQIRTWSKKFPCLRNLVIPIKQFLARRNLNNVHTGGMGGYSVVCMVVSFLSLHPKISAGTIDPMKNLGVLLIEFFELYGRKFNYDNVGLRMRASEIGYIKKKNYPELCASNNGPRNYSGTLSLVIEDPDDPTNNISRGTFNILKIRKAFTGAYDMLRAKCYEMDALSFHYRKGQSILGSIIKLKGPERDLNDFRSSVKNIAWIPPKPTETTSINSNNSHSKPSNFDVNTIYDSASDSDFEPYHRDSNIKNEPKKSKTPPPKNEKTENSSQIDKTNNSENELSDSEYKPTLRKAQNKTEIITLSDSSESEADIDNNYEPQLPSRPLKKSSSTDEEDSRSNISTSSKKSSKKRDYWIQKGGM